MRAVLDTTIGEAVLPGVSNDALLVCAATLAAYEQVLQARLSHEAA